MKTFRSLNALFALIMTFTLVSCNMDDDSPQYTGPLNIVDTAIATPELSSLVAALLAADGNLPQALSGDSFTVFAPTNEAFSAFLAANNFSSLEEVPTDVLSQILLNHVVSGRVNSSDLSTGYGETLATEATTGANLNIHINTSSGVVLNGISQVTTADIPALNGVIHIVDAVIGLPTVVDFALADQGFSTLVSALTRSDLTFDYVTTLSTTGNPAPFTIFAPTNDAFGSLLSELGATSLNDIDEPTLKATLDLHAVAGANVRSSDLTDNMAITTLGGDITGNVSGGATITDANGRVSNIIVVDVQAANGVIHAIDKVILPQLPQTIVGAALDTPELSILVDALTRADLVDTLNGGGEFTVFAPTNTAFTNFLAANGLSSLDDVPVATLTEILLNHVIIGEAMSNGLSTGYVSTLATKPGSDINISMFVNTASGVTLNGVSNVAIPDIDVSNGVVHVVDAVIGIPTIVDHAIANPDFTSLVGALTSGGNTTFTDLLSTPGDFTVFAPNNAAFSAFTNPSGNALDQILSNHVIVGATAMSGGLSNSYVNTAATFGNTSNALSMYINTDSGVTINGNSNVIAADVVASNGVIHAVDMVIDLPSIVDFALADPTFTTLVAALTREDLTFDYVTTLSTPNGTAPAPFTVFAPTNDAFGSLLTELGVGGLGDIGEPTLKATLDFHAVAGANVLSTDLTDNLSVGTLGGNITANVTGGARLTDGNNRTSNIIAVNVQAANGIIHVIDKVILPPL
ncbi:fasciclin domain-containing protein [Flavobacteriaceae sp. LMIT009]